jgi:DNA (cytosine-5)-methyltransferase 1
MVYYNEFDPEAAQWLRNLIVAGVIPCGDVDERSIVDVSPNDLAGYEQCHFFAGIGGWAYALRLAGWGDSNVWTGSPPCQPFSAAGKGLGAQDERNLWYAFYRLIRECKPATLFGEQVAQAIGYDWLDTVSTDLEQEGYAVGAAVLPACSVGAPHKRERLWFVADNQSAESECTWRARQRWTRPSDGGGIYELEHADSQRREDEYALQRRHSQGWKQGYISEASGNGLTHDLADSGNQRLQGGVSKRQNSQRQVIDRRIGYNCSTHNMADSQIDGLQDGQDRNWRREGVCGQSMSGILEDGSDGLTRGFWSNADWVYCRDEKYRPIEPGLKPLAHGVSGRVAIGSAGKTYWYTRKSALKGFGNAIVPQVAAEFIKAFMTRDE